MHAGAGKTQNRLVAFLACSSDGLGKHALDLLTGLGTIKQDGAPALPVGHFLTPEAYQVGLRSLSVRRFGLGDALLLGRLGAKPLARAVVDPCHHDRKQQKHETDGDDEQKRIRRHLRSPKLDESTSGKTPHPILTWIKFDNYEGARGFRTVQAAARPTKATISMIATMV
jgi:hypothetical protein